MQENVFSLGQAAVQTLNVLAVAAGVLLLIFAVRALKKYLSPAREQKKSLPSTVGQRIRSARQARSMTQEFVAEKLEVSRQAVSKWEKDVSLPGTAHLLALARLLNVPPEQLLPDKDE